MIGLRTLFPLSHCAEEKDANRRASTIKPNQLIDEKKVPFGTLLQESEKSDYAKFQVNRGCGSGIALLLATILLTIGICLAYNIKVCLNKNREQGSRSNDIQLQERRNSKTNSR
nr:hypothetical protein HmN_000176900 [Hymenolepis microstoma]